MIAVDSKALGSECIGLNDGPLNGSFRIVRIATYNLCYFLEINVSRLLVS